MNMKWMKKLVNKFTRLHPKIDAPIIWYKDIALIVGIVLILISATMGFYGKFLFISTIYQSPIDWLPGLSLWLFSWIVLFIGISLVGWETFRIIKYKIKHKMKKTYRQAKRIHRRNYYRAKRLHNKSLEKIAELSNKEVESINIK